MTSLTLGDIQFSGFEIPGRISFGGQQRLQVHKLIGGTRVVDALGRDDATLAWSGVLSGSQAADRARELDAIRVVGAAQTLTWDAFCYSVVIQSLKLDFRNSWWIPYQISCLVSQDLAQAPVSQATSLVAAIIDDVTSAQLLSAPGDTSLVSALTGILPAGTSGNLQAQAMLTARRNSLGQTIGAAGLALTSGDLGQLVTAAGSLATSSCANGFIERALMNIDSGVV